jgi:hypothetical protein
MESNGILELISNYGTSSIIAIFIIYALWFILSNFVSAKFKSFFSGNDKREKSKKDELKYHSFFTNAQYRIIAEIPALEILPEKPVKEKMFKDLITLETKTIYDTCQSIIILDLEDWSPDQWKTEISKKVNEMISTIFIKAKDEGIPEVVINRYNKWHAASFEMLYEYIATLATSLAYDDNIARTSTLLLIMNLMLVATIADAEKSLKDLNGEIAGKPYKNLVLED